MYSRALLLHRIESPPRILLAFVLFAIPAGFLLLSVVQARPFVDDVTLPPPTVRGEDWQVYRLYAESIDAGGLTIPVLEGPYVRPAGFLYNYFLAAIFKVIGDNASYAYVVQAALLGASVSVMYLAFARYLSAVGGAVFLALLTVLEYVDVYRNYTFRLLSENLLLFLAPWLFLTLLAAYRRRSVGLAALAGGVMGLCVLTRINLLPVAFGLTLLWIIYARRQHGSVGLAFVFGAVWCAITLLVPLRDLLVTGRFDFLLLTYTGDWAVPSGADSVGATASRSVDLLSSYLRNLLFVLGDTTTLSPDYRPRPHWFVLWAGFALGAVYLVRRAKLPLFWQAVVYGYVVLYLAPAIFVGYPGTYGFRTVVPALPAALLAATWAVDRQLSRV